ncbi:MAG: hypothetical protein ACO1NM_11095 [Sphingobium phenoxybenzoativorans]
MFPPEVIDTVWWPDLMDDEPQLWQQGNLKGFTERFRLSISGIVKQRVIIRLDVRPDGRIRGKLRLVTMSWDNDGLVIDTDRAFHVRNADMENLRTRIIDARLWNVRPQEHWVNDEICVDGEQLVFERLNADGYSFSEANAQCTAPPAILDVARSMIELSGAHNVLRLLQ